MNFTKEHKERLEALASKALFEPILFQTRLGGQITIYELIHTVSPNQVLEMRNSLGKLIQKKEENEWSENEDLTPLREKRELLNLVYGYKLWCIEQDTLNRKRKELSDKLAELKESQKTPEDRIKEIEDQLKELEEF